MDAQCSVGPDLVFEHRSANATVIVEYKMTSFGTAARTKKEFHARKSFDPEGTQTTEPNCGATHT